MNSNGVVLVVGSGPKAPLCKHWSKSRFSAIVVINNAWRIRDDWDYLIFPDDFPDEKRPLEIGQHQMLVQSDDYVPANNRFGGVFFAGGTMAFTAGYWALDHLKPSVLAFLGCDMVYPKTGRTHFYGNGTADPLRNDKSLRNLEAKSARLMLHAAKQGTNCVRIGEGESRLVFPACNYQSLDGVRQTSIRSEDLLFQTAKAEERRLNYCVASGRYWEADNAFDTAKIDALDRTWLQAAQNHYMPKKLAIASNEVAL